MAAAHIDKTNTNNAMFCQSAVAASDGDNSNNITPIIGKIH